MKKMLWMIFLIILIVVVDQWTKMEVVKSFHLGESYEVIKGFFNLTYVRNPGAAFGFGGAFADWIRYTILLVIPVLACFWLFYLLVKALKGPQIMAYAYVLILGGAIGNLIDRFRLNYVVDFFDFYYGNAHFATFNVADSAISIAAGLLIFDFFLQKRKESKQLNELPSLDR